MKVSIIYPPNASLINRIPLGPLTLASYINSRTEHVAKVINLNSYIKEEEITIDEKIYEKCAQFLLQKFNSKVYCFSAIVSGEIPSIQIARYIKQERPDITIIFGNQWVLNNDIEIINSFNFIDYVIRGEGELTLADLLNKIDTNSNVEMVNGITFRYKEQAQRTEERQLIENLDDLPILDLKCMYPKIDQFTPSPYGGHYGYLEFGRGCPYGCSFCSSTYFWKRNVRTYSVERTINDIQFLINNGFDFIEFTYDNFGTNRNEIITFCNELINNDINIKYSIRCRLDYLDLEIIHLLKRSGCIDVLVGLESASQDAINKIGKNLDFSSAKETIAILIDNGIVVRGSYVIGLPFEDMSHIESTVKMASLLQTYGKWVDQEIHFHTPLPGTPETLNAIVNDLLMFSLDSNISSDFAQYINWRKENSNENDHYSLRLQEDQELIDNYPTLFPQYGYIKNEMLDPEKITAVTTFFSVIMAFYPITLFFVVDILSNQKKDFIEEFLSYANIKGWSKTELFKFRRETVVEIGSACSPAEQRLFDLFCNFFGDRVESSSIVNELHQYECDFADFSINIENNFNNDTLKSKELSEHSVIKSKIKVKAYNYDVLSIIKMLKDNFFKIDEKNEIYDTDKAPIYLAFREAEGDYLHFASIDILTINEDLYKIFKVFDGIKSIREVVNGVYENIDDELIFENCSEVIVFLNENTELWENV
ncbi:B12-binding domain-containing radical SAM protein [Anaerosacchariphilus polymeriproducens]|uniref:Radical SAM protein n=1 Tax=Anaerosacchariphilus polymeriproducens TaxID=1812858 RepID=A0A371AT11_9FIRM|nr:radical SAM protein [Anaerosacchariphilus polymeriproducens]RDU22713.1 radical SAM protein [Anaerosacchariphilus polymeriproducens]